MSLEIFSIDYDGRLRAYCVNARCTYDWFLRVTKGAERNLQIQRQIIKGRKAYETLRRDLRRMCLLPPLVLAVKNLPVSTLLQTTYRPLQELEEKEAIMQLRDPLIAVSPENMYIIDGLQRTNAIVQTVEELSEGGATAFLGGRLRFELWLNIPFCALAYRMLVLNGGQRPMPIKFQIEILSMKLKEDLSTIPNIEILTSLERDRRTRKGQFNLALLSEAFQAWLQGQPNIDLRNLVMEELLAESAIDTLGASISPDAPSGEQDSFRKFVSWLVKIDIALPSSPQTLQFLSNDTVLLGVAAAVGDAERNAVLRARMEAGLNRLQSLTQESANDALGIEEFERVRKGIDPARVNVGQATRSMVYMAFREYFLADGTKTMDDCWRFAAGQA